MNVPWVCYTCHALLYGGVGLAYRAWNSVVFLLYSGIAKPSRCVKNRRTSRFFVCIYLRDWDNIDVETKYNNKKGVCRKSDQE